MNTRTGTATKLIAVLMAVALALLGAGCSKSSKTDSTTQSINNVSVGQDSAQAGDFSCPDNNTIGFAKTKFLTHTALGFGAFHRYLYNPMRDGKFKKGANGRVLAFIKAGAAGLFIKREIRLASEDAKANPTLCKVVAGPLHSIWSSLDGAISKLKGGDTSGVDSLNGMVGSVISGSQGQGLTITPDDNADITKPAN